MMAFIISVIVAVLVVVGGTAFLSMQSKAYVAKHPELRQQAEKDYQERQEEQKKAFSLNPES